MEILLDEASKELATRLSVDSMTKTTVRRRKRILLKK
jgi:hypothetical protein